MTSKEIALNYECPVCGAKPNMPCFGIPEDDPSRDPFDWRPAELMTPHKARETAYNRQNAAESLPAALVQETAVCPKCNRPHYNMEDSEFCRSMHDEEETPCPKREDGIHCNCWYDGNPCCACEDGKPETVAETKPTPSASDHEAIDIAVLSTAFHNVLADFHHDDTTFQETKAQYLRAAIAENGLIEALLPHFEEIAGMETSEPQPDSSSISTEHALETAVKIINVFITDSVFREAWSSEIAEVENAWNAAKGQSNGR